MRHANGHVSSPIRLEVCRRLAESAPPGRRYILVLRHLFNRRVSADDDLATWITVINNPAGPMGVEMKHDFYVPVQVPAAEGPSVELSMPEL